MNNGFFSLQDIVCVVTGAASGVVVDGGLSAGIREIQVK